jgi:hypothetical protein
MAHDQVGYFGDAGTGHDGARWWMTRGILGWSRLSYIKPARTPQFSPYSLGRKCLVVNLDVFTLCACYS